MQPAVLRLHALATVAFLCAPPGVLIVDGAGTAGTLPDVQTACNLAAEGDSILVKSGTYAGFEVVDKGLTIAADTNASVQLVGAARVRNLAASKRVTLIGLTSRGHQAGLPDDVYGLKLTANQGRIRVVTCTFQGANGSLTGDRNGSDGVRIDTTVDAAFTRCTSSGGWGETNGGRGGAGIDASASSVTLYACDLRGGPGRNGSSPLEADGGSGGHAFVGQSAVLFTSQTSFRGGDGGHGLQSCVGTLGGDGGNALRLTGPSNLARLVSSIESGGQAGDGHSITCTTVPGAQAAARSGGPFVDLPVTGRAVRVDMNPIREGSTMVVTFHGQPGDRVILVLSPLTTSVFNPQWNGQQLFPPAASSRKAVVLPPTGVLGYNLPISDLGPGVQAKTLLIQGLFKGATGERVLGTPVSFLVLDSAY